MNLTLLFLLWVSLPLVFCETKVKRYNKTSLMTNEFWDEQIFHDSIQNSLITCLGQCMSWPGTGSSEKFCNAAYYEKQSGICQLAELSSLIDTSTESATEAKVNNFRILSGNKAEHAVQSYAARINYLWASKCWLGNLKFALS